MQLKFLTTPLYSYSLTTISAIKKNYSCHPNTFVSEFRKIDEREVEHGLLCTCRTLSVANRPASVVVFLLLLLFLSVLRRTNFNSFFHFCVAFNHNLYKRFPSKLTSADWLDHPSRHRWIDSDARINKIS